MENLNRPLTTEEVLDSMTDEMAREQGYPNAEVFRLVYRLGNIAGKWRRTKDKKLIEEYHKLFFELIERGWDPYLLDIEDTLPSEHMPSLPAKAEDDKGHGAVKKAELVAMVAEKAEISRDEARQCLNAVLEVIEETLGQGERVVLTGFGSFRVSHVKARNGVNPRTSERITIPARRRPVFSAGRKLKRAVER